MSFPAVAAVLIVGVAFIVIGLLAGVDTLALVGAVIFAAGVIAAVIGGLSGWSDL